MVDVGAVGTVTQVALADSADMMVDSADPADAGAPIVVADRDG
jgi:hypothetical protein